MNTYPNSHQMFTNNNNNNNSKKSKIKNVCVISCAIGLHIILLMEVVGYIYAGFKVMIYPPKMGKGILDGYVNDYDLQSIEEFVNILMSCLGWIIIAMILDTIGNFLTQFIAIFWRYLLTRNMQLKYLSENMYYKLLILDKRVDNPDERLTNDIDTFCTLYSTILTNIFTAASNIVMYSWQCFKTVGWEGPLFVYLYFIIGTFYSYIYTAPLINLWYMQEKKEGDFRFSHTFLRNNIESVAFYRGEKMEFSKKQQYLKKVINNKLKITFTNIFLKMHMSLFGYVGGISNYLVIFIVAYVFHSFSDPTDTPGEVSEKIGLVSMELLQLIFGFTVLVQLGQDFSQMCGLVTRLGHFNKIMNELLKNGNTAAEYENGINFSLISTGFEIEFKNVDVSTPTNRILIKDLTLKIKEGSRFLIVGPNGCGKTTLLRILGGLWEYYHGIIKKPKLEYFFYIPQNPYLFIGSLKEQILYPYVDENSGEINEYLLEKVLDEVDLMYLLKYIKNINEEYNWENLLSGGEKQKLSFARFFYHFLNKSRNSNMKILILDESTSNMDLETEEKIMKRIVGLKITIISVAHRFTQFNYHENMLRIKKDGSYKISKIEKNQTFVEL